ncbi:hypothetical protein HY771_03005 [Candidatus Uhrbacteria bacterium]|nr:hypothetical protein [Candidatus Uhrbacteria bacterium]
MRLLKTFFLFTLFFPLITNAADSVVPTMESTDSVLVKMFDESVEVALESSKQTTDGLRYISAGPRYSNPLRVYYRDSYFASGMLLLLKPDVVRDQILLLARGVEKKGTTPSAIPVDPDGVIMPVWKDHYDSGPYFIMMIYDYVRWTGDISILDEQVGDRTIFSTMEDILTHLETLDKNGNLLPEKPANSLQDWLDSIPRGGEVLYDEVLYYRALRNMTELAQFLGKSAHATVFHRHSLLVRYQINEILWNDAKGYYFERCENGKCEDRLTNESSLAVLYDVVLPKNRERLMKNLEQLETRYNPNLMYGTWGVVNAYPGYPNSRTYFYQNMTDWPFLDGMNAGARLKYGIGDWYFPMTSWWTFFETQREEGERLPEFVSPIDLSGGRSQAWSVNPIVSFIRYGLGIDPALDGTYTIRRSPIGKIELKNLLVRGQRISVSAK